MFIPVDSIECYMLDPNKRRSWIRWSSS